jgi:DNA-binding NtrC family response regulator
MAASRRRIRHLGHDRSGRRRGAGPGTSLILYSGGMTSELAAEAQEFGVRALLEKPVSAERLIAAIRSS